MELVTYDVLSDVRRMAKDQKTPEATPEANVGNEFVGPPKSYRLQIALGFAALILFEMIVLWLLLPSRGSVGAGVGLDPVTGVGGFEDSALVPPKIGQAEKMVERPIKEGAFTVKSIRNEANETFSVVIRVKIRDADAKKFDKRYEACTYEIIDSVTTILDASTSDERMEAARTTIKEKVKRAVNEVLGTPWVQAVLFEDPSVSAQ